MKRHWQYLKYVLRHKWFVLQAGLSLDVPIWILLLHDWDKFLPDEWFSYADYFYGDELPFKDNHHAALAGIGIYPRSKEEIAAAFDDAWLKHQNRNKHHWQWWVLLNDDSSVIALPMPDVYRREMLADWIGAGKALGKPNTAGWYTDNREKMRLHPDTRAWLEYQLYGVDTATRIAAPHDPTAGA